LEIDRLEDQEIGININMDLD